MSIFVKTPSKPVEEVHFANLHEAAKQGWSYVRRETVRELFGPARKVVLKHAEKGEISLFINLRLR